MLKLVLALSTPGQRGLSQRCPAAQGIKRPELRDELYMQLLKQSRGNTSTLTATEGDSAC